MQPAQIYPSFSFSEIQSTIETNDEIEFQSGDYYFGDNTVWVKGPKKITGVGAVIHGTAYKLMADFIPDQSDWSLDNFLADIKKKNDPFGCGIFSVVGPGLVEISDFTFKHQINQPSPLGWHASGTIAYFVDNQVESSLIVKGCAFNTSATAAVDVWSINDVGIDPKAHDVIVRECTLDAVQVTDPALLAYGAGNYCGVVLGGIDMYHAPPRSRPVNMRGSRFEVRDCRFDPQKYPAIGCFNYESDSETEFRICNNQIGLNSPTGEATAMGILPGFKESGVYPKGTLLIMDNEINVETYFEWGGFEISAGISVPVNLVGTGAEPRLETVISGNKINLGYARAPRTAPPPGEPPANWCVSGIFLDDRAAGPKGSMNVAAIINNNEIASNGAAPPYWGICLGGRCHDVVVKGNDLRYLTASHAQIYIDENAYDCVVNENVLGALKQLPASQQQGPTAFAPLPEAVVLCSGDSNWLLANDFSNCNTPGWQSKSGPGFVKLGTNSENNVFVYPGILGKKQILNQGANNHIYGI